MDTRTTCARQRLFFVRSLDFFCFGTSTRPRATFTAKSEHDPSFSMNLPSLGPNHIALFDKLPPNSILELLYLVLLGELPPKLQVGIRFSFQSPARHIFHFMF